MLVSVVQQRESAICRRVSPPPPASVPPSCCGPLGSELSTRAAWQRPLSAVHVVVCVHHCCSLSVPLSPSCCVHRPILYTCVSAPALWRGSLVPFFWILYICGNMWYLFFSWLHAVWKTLGPSTALQMTQFFPFLWLNTPLYICTTSSLLLPWASRLLSCSTSFKKSCEYPCTPWCCDE